MKRFPTLFFILLSAFIVIAVNACTPEETQNPANGAATSVEEKILISEVLTGVTGYNNHDFVELANNGDRPVDLNGWSLSYRLASGLEDEVLFVWDSAALIPPHGHYLLVRAGVDIGVVADVYFDRGLNTSGGGLALRDASGEMVNALAWGNAPAAFTEGAAALQPESGSYLERAPPSHPVTAYCRNAASVNALSRPSPVPNELGRYTFGTGWVTQPRLDVVTDWRPRQDLFGAAVMIPKTTPEEQLAAWLYIKWFTEPEQMIRWDQISAYFPIRSTAAALSGLDEYKADNPQWTTALDLLQYAASEPQLVSYDSVRGEVSETYNRILQEDSPDIQAILDELNDTAAKLHAEVTG